VASRRAGFLFNAARKYVHFTVGKIEGISATTAFGELAFKKK
jgi:hypothetical protein